MSDNPKLDIRKTIRLTPELVAKWDPKKVRQFLGNGRVKSDNVRQPCNCEFYVGMIKHFIELMVEEEVSGGNFTQEEWEYVMEVLKNEY